MASVRAASIGGIALFALLTSGALPAHPQGPAAVPGEVLLRFKPKVPGSRHDHARDDLGAKVHRRYRSGAEHWKLPPGLTTEKAIERLSKNPDVEYVEPNVIFRTDRVPNDPYYPRLWGLRNTGQTGGTAGADVRAEQAWNVTTGSRDVIVAVIDTGVDITHPDLAANIHMPSEPGVAGRRMISIVDEKKLRRILARMLDEKEFFGAHGIRALSRAHLEKPYVFQHGGQEFRVGYVPGDSDTGMFGGNSNWRGPVWMPVNFLLWVALLRMGAYYGDSFKVECPTGSGKQKTLFGVAHELAERLIRTFTRDASGRRPVYGGAEKFQTDPNWRDLVLFYEYFHGDNGAGIGASHQTGWTGVIARIIQGNGLLTEEILRAPDLEQRAIREGAR